MMIALLHGGAPNLNSYQDFCFWKEMGNIRPKWINVLSIHQAGCDPTDDNSYASGCSINLQGILNFSNPDKMFTIMPARLDQIEAQIANSSVIYVHGGDGDLLYKAIGGLPWQDIDLTNKIIAGHSAGANIWSKYYYSNDNQAIQQGLGILNIKTFCHYAGFKHEQLNMLINHDPGYGRLDLPVIPLLDEGYVKLEIP